MQNTLFNDKTIQRLISDTKITSKQKKASQDWIELMDNKELMKEKQGYLKFHDIILKDLLGYDNIKHEKEGIEFSYEKDNKSIVRIEAKGMDTPDLFLPQKRAREESPVQQVWRYMQLHATPYGIVTNYKIFILFKYDVGSTKYYLFDFEDIKRNSNELKEFVAIFSKESVDGGFIDDLYEKSIIEEREFTKEFYKLYHETRLMLIKEFEQNTDINKDVSVHFAQIFLNRLMFVFFAEDTGKIEKGVVEERLLKTLNSIHLFSSNSNNISNVLVGFFRDLDNGSDFPVKLFGFNGGLFRHPIPERIHFKDFREDKFFREVYQNSKLKSKDLELNEKEKEIFEKYKNKLNPIIKNILLMASFDFKSEVNVNILGHIFEQSISDIEELKTDKTSRRKKEGIFYTPEYITDYICRNTIIPYLSNNGANTTPDLIREYADNIKELESKFKQTKILDIACGSGAFLIKATEIMLEIFKAIQEFNQQEGQYEAQRGLKRKSNHKGQLVLTKWNEEEEAKEIIENNIYGVDINEESVEITKLSLFLKMARKNRKLTDLSNNIKQGNSLIDDERIAGKLAFDWDKEFPFKFDVVIGNPPYVDSENMTKYNKKERDYLAKKYTTTQGNWDLYIPFIEKAFSLLNPNGKASMITPNKWLSISYGSAIRNFVGKHLYQLSDYSNIKVFEDAGIFPIIFFISKIEYPELNVKRFYEENKFVESTIKKNVFDGFDNFGIFFSKNIKLIMRLLQNSKPLGNICDISGAFTTSEAYELIPLLEDKEGNKEEYLKLINTGTIDKYYPLWSFQPTKYIKNEYIYPVVSRKEFKNKFSKRYERFDKPKIIISGIRHFECFYDKENEYLAGKSTSVLTNIKEKIAYEVVNCVLNSRLITFYLKEGFSSAGMDGGINFSPAVISTIPILKIDNVVQSELIKKSDSIVSLYKEFYEKKAKFLKLIKHEYKIENISRKLDNFYELDFDEFVNQLKIKLSIDKKTELLNFFEKNKKEVMEISDKIRKIDEEINNIVYDLYGITKEEKEIIENGQ